MFIMSRFKMCLFMSTFAIEYMCIILKNIVISSENELNTKRDPVKSKCIFLDAKNKLLSTVSSSYL